LESALTANDTERSAVQKEFDPAEAECDPRPRDPEFWLRRQRPEGVTADGAPFWRLIETLDCAPAAQLEAALDAAGLLHPDMSAAQLARRSFVTAQSMADVITALQARGLIERHRDQADRRRLVVALTSAGRELLDDYRDQVAALEERMLAGLSSGETSQLRRSLHACRANLAGQAVPAN
jgi:DNA-binding MarR family transcriptional regulator